MGKIYVAAIVMLMAWPTLADTWGPTTLWPEARQGKCVDINGHQVADSMACGRQSVSQICLPGWVLVQVSQTSGGMVNKCAAVGDLRDPE